MRDALIYDHVRTPRGRGRPDGSLHEITAVEIAATPLRALAERNRLDTALIDDVIYGCAQPVGRFIASARQHSKRSTVPPLRS